MTLKPHHILEERWADGQINEIRGWKKNNNKVIEEKGKYIGCDSEWTVKWTDGVEYGRSSKSIYIYIYIDRWLRPRLKYK